MTLVSQDMGRIYLYRVTSMGAAVQPAVRVNDEKEIQKMKYIGDTL